MPRAKAEDIKTVKRAPRKRAVRRVVSKEEAPQRKSETPVEASRKAPTRIVTKEKSKRGYKKMMIVGGILLLGFGAAAYIGNSDSGQINIASVIDERNKQTAAGNNSGDGSSGASTVIPVQNTAPPSVPNGGLRGRGVGTAKVVTPPPIVEEATSSATSTATSTDDSIETDEEAGDEPEAESDADENVEVEEDTPAVEEVAP